MTEVAYSRRFVVADSKRSWLDSIPWSSTSLVVDGYLRVTPRSSARVRRLFTLSADRLRQTGHESRLEIGVLESESSSTSRSPWLQQRVAAMVLPPALAEQALLESPYTKVHKQTSVVNIDGHPWVVDDYRWENRGLIIATFSSASAEEVQRLRVPAWCDGEVSAEFRFSDEQLAVHPFTTRPLARRAPSNAPVQGRGLKRSYQLLADVGQTTHVEIERRFIATVPSTVSGPDLIIQDYLVSGDQVAIRLRMKGPAPLELWQESAEAESLFATASALPSACITVKGKREAISRVEIEHEFDPKFIRDAIDFTGNTLVLKKRFPVIDADLWTLDVFLGRNAPLVIAECEVESERAASLVKPPSFCVSEIINDSRYDNDQLAVHPFQEWGDPIGS